MYAGSGFLLISTHVSVYAKHFGSPPPPSFYTGTAMRLRLISFDKLLIEEPL